jgi:hypothetical protein
MTSHTYNPTPFWPLIGLIHAALIPAVDELYGPPLYEGLLCSHMVCESGVSVLYVVALATFDLATSRAGASRGLGGRRR